VTKKPDGIRTVQFFTCTHSCQNVTGTANGTPDRSGNKRAEPESRIQPQMPLFGARHDESHSVADGDESLPGHIAGITNNNILVVIMKFAIARDGNMVSGHFGHCEGDILFTGRNGKIVEKADLPNPGHEPGRLPAPPAEHNVTHIVVGGMGPKAVNLFSANNIEVFLGISGNIDSVIRDFIGGSITHGQISCTHGSNQESCGY